MIQFSNFDFFLKSVKDFTQEDLVEERLTLLKNGIDIDFSKDIFTNPHEVLFTILSDGSVKRVNLYIAEQITTTKEKFIPKYKYHIYQCQTLQEMFSLNRKYRYKINTRVDGTFFYRYISFYGDIYKEIENEKLKICKNCLKKYLEEKGIYQHHIPNEVVENFDLKKFHKEHKVLYEFDIKDFEFPQDAKLNIYTKNWKYISKKIKQKRDWTCEECGFRPKNDEQKRFIHLHHINANKTDNQETNLKVLCIKCHANVDKYHNRIKNTKDYKKFIYLTSY